MPFSRGPDGERVLPSQPVAPDMVQTVTAPHKIKIEPSAIPEAIKVFERALEQLTMSLDAGRFGGYDQPVWAGDHVSQVTAERFNNRASTEPNSAMAVLHGYRTQLTGVVEQLRAAEQIYQQTEGNNAALWKGQQA